MAMLRGAIRAIACLLWILFCLLSVVPCALLGWHRARSFMTQVFFSGVLVILGIRYHVKGSLHDTRPLLLLSNHASYLDTFVLGAMTPVAFTPKREVRHWPVIGWLCVLAGCVFVERRPSQMHAAREEMAARIKAGQLLCIFPEGTTNDSTEVKPFKSGFISLAEDHDLPVQPVTISYVALNGHDIPAKKRHHVAWVGDDDFFTHFLRFMRYRSLDVVVHFHAVQCIRNYEDRKALSKYCEDTIRSHLLTRPEQEACR
jgi:1-acyl-sn-glycerol-3-phosphate acyltransferase